MTNQFLQRSNGFFRTYALWVLPLLFASLFLRLFEYLGLESELPLAGDHAVYLVGLLKDAGFTPDLSFSFSFPIWLLSCLKPNLSGKP